MFDSENFKIYVLFPDECKDCHDQKKSPATATVQPNMEAAMAEGILKERPAEEVAARIAQQNQEEQDIVAGRLAILKHLHIQHLTGKACGQSCSLCLSDFCLHFLIMMEFTPSNYSENMKINTDIYIFFTLGNFLVLFLF